MLKQVVLIVEAVDDPYYFHSFHSRHSLGFSASRLLGLSVLGFSVSRLLGFSAFRFVSYFRTSRLIGFSASRLVSYFSAFRFVQLFLGFSVSRFLVAFLGPCYPCFGRVAIEGKPWTRKESTRRGREPLFFPQRLNPLLKCSKSSTSPATQNKRKSSSHSKWRTQVVWCYLSCDLKSPNFVPLLVCTCAIFVVVPSVNQHCCLLITPAVL